ncbi:hypothetical protein M409DRAFT_70581 [Zasmidium cellare ATCC 36951]|uniref:NAD(P)-binding protein n=1 Tax=Zasmidium cellare ATCC 36951 TaxID=1080233 RepID=A0A6A6C3A8_ZASCE|nr:uncharacterized protein M409DRAFT_70581 [Zasmidium cellare ATCC 36951]KAF2160229.1 hypothetical protein M409DRAFT_70581 [Zasmidium cellare ATCC 36951]
MASSSFEGKIAIVTGASRGVGREIAIQFAKREKTLQAFSVDGVDILVNNAGLMNLYPMGQLTSEAYHTVFDTNVLAPLLLIQATLPVIKPGGSIIKISSRAARVALGGQATIYAASKAALEHMTRNLATAHAAERKITINNVLPGGIETDMIATAPQAMIDRVKNDATAEKRLGQPGEIADVVCFVAEGGGGARWINGDTISVCGGAAMW